MLQLLSLIGIPLFIGLAILLSNNRKQIQFQTLIYGLSLQVILAILVLGIPILEIEGPLKWLFNIANDGFMVLLSYTDAGSSFLFGPLYDKTKMGGTIFALHVLPTIIFFSALMSVLYHIGIMQIIVKSLSIVMQKTMKLSGAESLSAAANIFVGQTEAPLIIKPYVAKMTRSEIMVVMTGGMATVAGGVMAAYVEFLSERIPNIAGHLLTASVMSAPAAIAIAKIMIPETETPETYGKKTDIKIQKDVNIIEAAARGASEGLKLALNVGAMLLVFIALIALINGVFRQVGYIISFDEWGTSLVPELFIKNGTTELSLEIILGWIFSPFAFFMGIPWNECFIAGGFLGEKLVINEFYAYAHLSQLSSQLSDRTVIILSYALCGFANFSSIAIQIGGIGGIAPNQKSTIAQLGIRSIIGGTLAAFMTACIAGFLL